MKNIVILLTLIIACFNCGSLNLPKTSKLVSKDTIIVEAIIHFDSILESNYLECKVLNLKNDTLVFLPLPFLVRSTLRNENLIWVFTGNHFTTPNIVYLFKQQNKISYLGDGEYIPIFNTFPKINILPPNDSLIFKINIGNNFINNVSIHDVDFWGILVYGTMAQIESIFKNYDINVSNLFFENLEKESQILINPINLSEFTKKYSGNITVDSSITNFISSIFINKLDFRKNK